MDDSISHDKKDQRFWMQVDGHRCELVYSWHEQRVSFDTVRVPEAVGGRGIAGQLTRHALDWARAEGLTVQPACPYVANWVQRHPDYADLVA
ncbi:MAG: GNAT family N-acetyltransferase [Wenzhouxiangella sp.]